MESYAERVEIKLNEKFCAEYNQIEGAISEFTKEEILLVYQKMTLARTFEQYIVQANEKSKYQIKVHMSSGQEAVSAALAVAAPTYQYFVQHRSMDTFLALGGPPEELRDEICCLPGGCVGGKLGGAFQYHQQGKDMYAHTGLIGENISVGVGAALGNGRKTLCLFGDGAAEEDYALSAYGFAATHKLPVLFVCTDNELSVLSPLSKRRSWELCDVAQGFGLAAQDLTDDPFSIMHWVKQMESQLPALLNIRVCRNYWHAGLGVDGPPRWDRYQIVKEQLQALGWEAEQHAIEVEAEKQMEAVWKAYL